MSYKLGKRSITNLGSCNRIIVLIVLRTIELSKVDFGILNNGGKRSPEMQNGIFKKGNSKCDGYIKLSYHQSGKAVDLVPYIDGKYTWANKEAFIHIIRAWRQAERELKEKGLIPIDVEIHHGIYWKWKDENEDGELDMGDRLGWDAAHHEMRTKKQII